MFEKQGVALTRQFLLHILVIFQILCYTIR